MLAADRLQALIESRAGGDKPGRDRREDEPRHRSCALDGAARVAAGDQAQARGRRRARRAAEQEEAGTFEPDDDPFDAEDFEEFKD